MLIDSIQEDRNALSIVKNKTHYVFYLNSHTWRRHRIQISNFVKSILDFSQEGKYDVRLMISDLIGKYEFNCSKAEFQEK